MTVLSRRDPPLPGLVDQELREQHALREELDAVKEELDTVRDEVEALLRRNHPEAPDHARSPGVLTRSA